MLDILTGGFFTTNPVRRCMGIEVYSLKGRPHQVLIGTALPFMQVWIVALFELGSHTQCALVGLSAAKEGLKPKEDLGAKSLSHWAILRIRQAAQIKPPQKKTQKELSSLVRTCDPSARSL